MAEVPARNFITTFEDSRRWRHIVRRPGDIIISTPPKSGTTWMQGIVHSLLWPGGDAPGSRGELSPWIDMRMTPVDELADQLDRQTHRRFLKTHSPGDSIPFDRDCRYIVVYRDGRDALVSWGNHRQKLHAHVVESINEAAATAGVQTVNAAWDGDYDELFDEWDWLGSPVRHLATWWSRRHAPNVLFVHYGDLTADLQGEMRRIAEYLEVGVSDSQWTKVVDRCRLDTMRAKAHERGSLDAAYQDGAAAFFYQGRNGRWRDILTDAQVDRYLAIVATELPADAATWLEHGSLATARPNDTGEHQEPSLNTGTWHPVFSRLAKPRPSNSLDAIADCRVGEARDAGLFDDLPLHGKPIPDLDRHRPPGWWANRFVARERNKVTALELEAELRAAKPALWRLDSEQEVVARVGELNERIDRYNQVTTLAPMTRLDATETLATWRDLRDR